MFQRNLILELGCGAWWLVVVPVCNDMSVKWDTCGADGAEGLSTVDDAHASWYHGRKVWLGRRRTSNPYVRTVPWSMVRLLAGVAACSMEWHAERQAVEL